MGEGQEQVERARKYVKEAQQMTRDRDRYLRRETERPDLDDIEACLDRLERAEKELAGLKGEAPGYYRQRAEQAEQARDSALEALGRVEKIIEEGRAEIVPAAKQLEARAEQAEAASAIARKMNADAQVKLARIQEWAEEHATDKPVTDWRKGYVNATQAALSLLDQEAEGCTCRRDEVGRTDPYRSACPVHSQRCPECGVEITRGCSACACDTGPQPGQQGKEDRG